MDKIAFDSVLAALAGASKSQTKRTARQEAPREKVNPAHTWHHRPCKKCGRVYCPCPHPSKKEEEEK